MGAMIEHRIARRTMELSQLVENAYAAGRAAWPGVRLDKGAFAERIQSLSLDAENLTARASDVYLATACLARDSAAVLAFAATGMTLMIREEPIRARPLQPAAAVTT